MHTMCIFSKKKLLVDGGLYDINNVTLLHHTNQALKARFIFEKEYSSRIYKYQLFFIEYI